MITPLPPHKTKALLLPLLFFLLLFAGTTAQATHLYGGQIYYQSDTTSARNPLRFFFTLVTYTVAPPPFEDQEATLYFGNCTSQTSARESRTLLSNGQNNTFVNIYRFEHTFSGAGTYQVSYNNMGRNSGVINLNSSLNLPFFVQSTIVVDPFIGVNRSPQFLSSPVDLAVRNQPFVHNLMGYDADGDSLSYKVINPLTSNGVDACGNPIARNAVGYRGFENFLGTSNPSRPSGYTCNTNTGQFIWNSPGTLGEYAFAVVVEEWRNGRLIGRVIRDRPIFVRDDSNRPPSLTMLKDTCIVAGATLRETVSATDPDRDRISVRASLAGNFSPRPTSERVNDTAIVFIWQTSCDNVQRMPYQAELIAEDSPGNEKIKLSDMQSWRIRVLGPPPVLVSATPQNGNSIRLTWENYTCANARRIFIYRKVNTTSFTPTACEAGIPSSAGYVLVSTVAANLTSFSDNNNGQGLDLSQNYSYRIYADFNEPKGGSSVASNEVSSGRLTGISEGMKPKVNAYPNPASDVLNLHLETTGVIRAVKVFNLVGRSIALLLPQKQENGWVLDVRTLADGFYLLALQTDRGTVIQRIVVKH